VTSGPASSPRIPALDALRGIAVIGIVLMNVFAFAMPAAAYYNPRAWGGDGPAELIAWAVSFVLVEDKFRNLFAMMFGAGVAILLERGGKHPLRAHYARMVVLLAIGWLHALLLSSSDVLRLYAICGLVLPLVARWPAKRLWLAAAALMALYLTVAGWIAWQWLAADPSSTRLAEIAFGADPEAIARGLELGRETLTDRIARRLNPLMALPALVVVLPTTLAAMLAGIALWKNRLLAAEWPGARLLRLGAMCVLIAVPPLVAFAVWAISVGLPGVVVGANALVFSAPFDLVLAVGWAALAMALFAKAAPSALAATGRMALTNYLATSVVLGFACSSWGLGLFGAVARFEAYALALVPIALMLLWSPWLLARFRQGPAEWLWRSLARGSALPFRR
jgi:uncharacterized protein